MQTSPAWIPSREPVARSMAVRWAVCCYSSTSSTFHYPTSPSNPAYSQATTEHRRGSRGRPAPHPTMCDFSTRELLLKDSPTARARLLRAALQPKPLPNSLLIACSFLKCLHHRLESLLTTCVFPLCSVQIFLKTKPNFPSVSVTPNSQTDAAVERSLVRRAVTEKGKASFRESHTSVPQGHKSS